MELKTTSHIKGAFKGWNGNNVYVLDNGQAWKQTHYKYSYHYAYRPKVNLWRDGSTYYLEVDGMREMVEVRQATSSEIEEAEQEDD